MKSTVKILISALALSFMATGLYSCIGEGAEDCNAPVPAQTGEGEPIEIKVKGPSAQDETTPVMKTELYAFNRTTGAMTDYTLYSVFNITASGQKINIPREILLSDEFRFLFLSYDKSARGPAPINSVSGNALAAGDNWSDLILQYAYSQPSPGNAPESLSEYTYYGIVDMAGTLIMSSGEIHGDLKRIIGQTVFDFFKGTDSENPLPVENNSTSETVASILDRIYKVEISYTGMTDRISFDASTLAPVPERTSAETITYEVAFGNEDDSANAWKVSLPITDVDAVVDPLIANGSARIKGLCFLPSETGMNAVMKFWYFDTTQKCGYTSADSDHSHDKNCYDRRSVSLTVPASGRPDALPVVSDHLTVTKAAVPCNRIIDLKRSGGFVVDDYYEWTIN